MEIQNALKPRKLPRNQIIMILTGAGVLGVILAAIVSSVNASGTLSQLEEINAQKAIIEAQISGKKIEQLKLYNEWKEISNELDVLREQRKALENKATDTINAPLGLK